ncbi:MAG TPA: hypothetical protein VJR92_02215 [Gemmatimonadaceae bacterium]|nr:hypothetical protein [Gemmatimonadaceae bacterium]
MLSLAVVFAAACGGGNKDEAPPLTKRQSDSVIGASKIPGAGGVRGAMAASDTMDARRKRADSIAKADTGQ